MTTDFSTYWNSLTPPRRRSLTAVACFSFALLVGEAVVGWQIHKMNTELEAISERVNNIDRRLDNIENAIGPRDQSTEPNPF